MVLGHRRIGDEVLAGEDDASIELLFAPIDSCQDEGCGKRLEGAAKRKDLVASTTDAATARRIQRRHTQPSAVAAFEFDQSGCCIVGESRHGQQRHSKEATACDRSGHVLSTIRGECLRAGAMWRGKCLSVAAFMR
jgi:hypothetical protein